MTKHTEEFSHLTFSQREGLIPIPGPLELGNLPDDLRYELWKVFENVFVDVFFDQDEGKLLITPNFEKEIKEILSSLLGLSKRYLGSLDEFDLYKICERGFVSWDHNILLDFLEMTIEIKDANDDIPF